MPYQLDGYNDLYAVFNEERGVSLGDPYDKGRTALSRHYGKQFAAPWQPKGNGPDGMIDKTTPLTVPGDHYVEPYSLAKDLSRRSGSIHPKAFVPSSGHKKPSGAGSLYGIFGKPETMVDTDASTAAHIGRPSTTPADRKRNFTISPPKKGSFGYPWQDRSIGGTRFDFVPDEYCRGRILEKTLKKEARAKIVKPFVAAGVTGRGITPTPIAAVVGPDRRDPARASSAPAQARQPWRFNNPPAKGQGYGTLSRIPYIPSPTSPTQKKTQTGKYFKPPDFGHKRLSMWSPNPHAYAARPPPDNDLSLLT